MTPDIDQEASDWFARLRGPEGEAQRDAFERWRSADSAHADAYRQVERLWAVAGAVRRAPAPQPRAPWRQWRRPALAAAALAAGLAIVIALTYHPARRDLPGPAIVAFGSDPTRVVRLADGSLVLLGPYAAIAADMTGTERRVLLRQGAARFLVANDPRPFRIVAADSVLVGFFGAFDVRKARDGVAVVAQDGSLDMATRQGDPVHITAGQSIDESGARHAGGTPPGKWASRISVNAMPLEAVLLLANRGAAQPITLSDPIIGRLAVTGTFDLTDTAALARKLAATFDLTVHAKQSRLVLGRR